MLRTLIFLIFYSKMVYCANPCTQLLCLTAAIDGFGVIDGCSEAIDDYFDIVVFKNGVFSPENTAIKRNEQLHQCTGSNSDMIDKVNNHYGILRGIGVHSGRKPEYFHK